MKSFLVVVFCVAAGFNGVLCADRTLKRYPRQVEYAEGNVANSGQSPDVHGNYAIPSFPRQATSASYPGDLSAFLTTSPIPSSRDTDRKASRQVRRIDDPYNPQSFSSQGSYQNPPTSTVLFPGPSTIPQQSHPPQAFPPRYQPADYTVDALPPAHFSAPPPPPPPPNQGYVQNQQQAYSRQTSFAPQGQSIFSPSIQGSQPSFRPPIQDSQPNFRPTIQNSQPNFHPTIQETQPNFPPRPDVDLPPQIPLTFGPRPNQEPPRFSPRPDLNAPPPRETQFSTRPDLRNELPSNLPPRPDVDLPPPRKPNSLSIRPDVDVPTRQPAADRPNQDIEAGRNFFSQPDTNFSPPIRTAPPRPLTTPSPPPTPAPPPPPAQFRPLPSTRPPPPGPVSLTIPGQSYRNIRQPLNTIAVPAQPPHAPGNSIGASVAPFPFGDVGPESAQRPPTRDFAPQPTARPPVAPPARPQPIAFPRAAQEKATRPPARQPQEPPRHSQRRPVDEPEPRRRVPPQPIDEPEPPRHVPRRVINEPTSQRHAPRQPVIEPEPPRQSRRLSRVQAEAPREVAPKSFRIDTPLEFQRRPTEYTEGPSNARSNRSRQPVSSTSATSPAPTRAPRQPSTQNAPSRNTQRQSIQTINNERSSRPASRREPSSRDVKPNRNEEIQARPLPTPEVVVRPLPPPVEVKPVPSSPPTPENSVRPPFSPQPPQRPLGAPVELPPGVPAVYDPNNPYPTPRKPLPGAPPPPPLPNNAQFPILQNLPYPKKEQGPELRPLSAQPNPPNTQTQRRRNPIISNEAVPENRRPSRPEHSPVIITPIRAPARDEAEQQTDAPRPKNKRRRKHRRRTTVAPTTENKELSEKPLTVPPQNLETASTPSAGPSSTPESFPKRRRNRRKKNRTTPVPDASAGDSTLEDDETPPNRGRLGRNRI